VVADRQYLQGPSKKVDIDLNGDGTKEHVEMALLMLRPSDVAVTFIDSFEGGKGDFGVLLNDVDTDATQKWYNRVRFTGTSYDTASLAAGAFAHRPSLGDRAHLVSLGRHGRLFLQQPISSELPGVGCSG
jgi:hypothetical protein